MSNELLLKPLIDTLSPTLKAADFKRHVKNYSRSNFDVVQEIKIQSSQGSTSSVLKLTVNIELYSIELRLRQDTYTPNPHYYERIGWYLDVKHDKWWVIENEIDAVKAGNEIIDVITQKILPVLDSLRTSKDLIALWNTGKAPGLGEMQRKEYLKLLEDI